MLEFVTAGGERRYAALIRRHDRQLELANGNVSARFDLGDVLSLWTGAALTVWKPPMAESVKLRLGETAPIVGRIRQQLGLGATPGAENLYDEGLMTRIMEFQNAHGLKADGIVGAMTLFHLQAAGADSGIPRLIAASP
jgi:general secretion pathway protein A